MKTKVLDIAGISAAVLCLIHCIAFPLLMILPLGITHNPLIDLFFLLVGLVIVTRVTRKIDKKWLKSLFWISIIFIAISVISDLFFELHLPLIYFGAIGLITAHLINFKFHKH